MKTNKKRKAKTKKKGTISFQGGVLKDIAKSINSQPFSSTADLNKMSKYALVAARKRIKKLGGSKRIKLPRMIPVPRRGGFLIPLFAGLSALGGLAGGAASIANAVNKTKIAQKQLEESRRHNKAMETKVLNSTQKGRGIFLKPYKHGLGLYIQQMKKKT